jgi:tetratricopeptide (TPR) repeat protein
MWYIFFGFIITISILVIIFVIRKNVDKLSNIDTAKTKVQEKQAEIKKKLLESKLEKNVFNFFKVIIDKIRNFKFEFKGRRVRPGKMVIKKENKRSTFFNREKKDKDFEIDDERRLKGDLLSAQADLKKRRIDEAEDKFIEILQKDPKNIEAYMGLGKIYVIRKEFETAEEAYRYIVKINKKFFEGYRELVNVFELSKKWGELKKVGKEVIELGHENAWVFEKMGIAYKKTGYPDKAEGYFERAVEIEPQNERLLDELLEVAILNKNKGLARKAFNTLSGISRDEMKMQSYRDKIDIM